MKRHELLASDSVKNISGNEFSGLIKKSENISVFFEQARGGVLLIDQVCSMKDDATNILVEHMQSADFKGQVLILLGVDSSIDADKWLSNPDHRLRDYVHKRMVSIPMWTGVEATHFVMQQIERIGIPITKEAQEALSRCIERDRREVCLQCIENAF